MRTLLLVLLFIAVPLAGGSLKPEQESDHWKDSGADLSFAQMLINDRECASSGQHFNACRAALLAGARLLKVENQKDFRPLKQRAFSASLGFSKLLSALMAVETSLPAEYVVGKMVNAQLKAFDRFARLLPRSYFEWVSSAESKTYFGAGLETQATAAGLFVFQVFDNTPASHAGLKPHDRIVSVNGFRAGDLYQSHAAGLMLSGRAGDRLKLEIERRGRRVKPVTLAIAPVVVPEILDNELEFMGQVYLHVRLRSFSRGTCEKLNEKIEAANAAGVILDLRHNRGGFVEEGECVARLFVGSKRIVSREPLRLGFPAPLDFPQPKLPDNTRTDGAAAAYPGVPLVVLIDADSASASEIVAGALQDYGRAWIVGDRSYGKGLTQIMHNPASFSRLIVSKTVSQYVRPSGLGVHATGVTPNFTVSFAPDASAARASFLREENSRSAIKLPKEKRWSEDRVQAADHIRICLASKGQLTPAEAKISQLFGYADQQASFGLAILSCR